jgi:hypothetical protein
MAGELTLQVSELDRDRYTRITSIDFNKKKVRAPCFVTQIHNPYEFNIYFDLKQRYSPTQLDAFVVRYPDVPSILRRVQPNVSNDILGRVRDDKYTLFMKDNLFLIDPAMDYLFYNAKLDSFSLNHRTPQCIIDYASKLRTEKKNLDPKISFESRKDKLHKEFWHKRVDSNSEKMAFVKSILGYERDSGVDILLPPTPLIDCEEMLKIAIEINDTAKEIARIHNKLCATYLNIKSTLLKSDQLMDKIKMAVYENASRSLTVFKFKNLDLTLPNALVQRENYRQLMLDLAYYSKDYKDRACMILENSTQSFVSPFAGFDFVSSSFTFYDKDISRSTHPPYGSYLDPIGKIHLPFDDVARSYDELGRLRCTCESCKEVKVPDLRELRPEQWNVIRRTHIPMSMNHWMKYVIRAVKERNTELVRDNFANSKVSNLKDVLP